MLSPGNGTSVTSDLDSRLKVLTRDATNHLVYTNYYQLGFLFNCFFTIACRDWQPWNGHNFVLLKIRSDPTPVSQLVLYILQRSNLCLWHRCSDASPHAKQSHTFASFPGVHNQEVTPAQLEARPFAGTNQRGKESTLNTWKRKSHLEDTCNAGCAACVYVFC